MLTAFVARGRVELQVVIQTFISSWSIIQPLRGVGVGGGGYCWNRAEALQRGLNEDGARQRRAPSVERQLSINLAIHFFWIGK